MTWSDGKCRCRWANPGNPRYIRYHDEEWGVPVHDDRRLFEMLILEGFQAGLSWECVLNKQEAFRRAFDDFDWDKVAAYDEARQAALYADPGIIRNRLKVDAAIHNAQVIQTLRTSHGGFAAWLDAHHPLPKADWVKLFKKTFRFTGGEITGEFLMSLGYLPGAHRDDCPVMADIIACGPPWARS